MSENNSPVLKKHASFKYIKLLFSSQFHTPSPSPRPRPARALPSPTPKAAPSNTKTIRNQHSTSTNSTEQFFPNSNYTTTKPIDCFKGKSDPNFVQRLAQFTPPKLFLVRSPHLGSLKRPHALNCRLPWLPQSQLPQSDGANALQSSHNVGIALAQAGKRQ